ncbi:hypothetical protein TREES_T100010047 [Tupaia chinensis]|uniref:Uncharacterized protein n=1 Tax=Tupaia chinensis TaxID=246437 RepID=L9KHL1_TUPCH|nr:hypothetical protein TREES_T100010047 [Tupaia chinensis]
MEMKTKKKEEKKEEKKKRKKKFVLEIGFGFIDFKIQGLLDERTELFKLPSRQEPVVLFLAVSKEKSKGDKSFLPTNSPHKTRASGLSALCPLLARHFTLPSAGDPSAEWQRLCCRLHSLPGDCPHSGDLITLCEPMTPTKLLRAFAQIPPVTRPAPTAVPRPYSIDSKQNGVLPLVKPVPVTPFPDRPWQQCGEALGFWACSVAGRQVPSQSKGLPSPGAHEALDLEHVHRCLFSVRGSPLGITLMMMMLVTGMVVTGGADDDDAGPYPPTKPRMQSHLRYSFESLICSCSLGTLRHTSSSSCAFENAPRFI